MLRESYHHRVACWILKSEQETAVSRSATGMDLLEVPEFVSQGTFSPYLSLNGHCWFLTLGSVLHFSSVHLLGHSSGHSMIHDVSIYWITVTFCPNSLEISVFPLLKFEVYPYSSITLWQKDDWSHPLWSMWIIPFEISEDSLGNGFLLLFFFLRTSSPTCFTDLSYKGLPFSFFSLFKE